MYVLQALWPAVFAGAILGVCVFTKAPNLVAKMVFMPVATASAIWMVHMFVGLPNFGFPLFPDDWYPFRVLPALFGSLFVTLIASATMELLLVTVAGRKS